MELYPGITTEAVKEPMIPGVGIAPTYTISRAVLSDAVALVRGDRFYTVCPTQSPRRASRLNTSLTLCIQRLAANFWLFISLKTVDQYF